MRTTIAAARSEYLTWRKSQGFADGTIKNDRVMLDWMIAALGDHAEIGDIDDRAVLKVLEYASSVRCTSSLNLIQANMGAFFKWCRLRKHMTPDQNPLLGLRYRRVPKKERVRLALHEFPAFLDAADNPRDRFACALGLYLFLRASEVVALRVRDLDLQAGTIGVTIQKTGDYDVMPISKELDKEARRYLLYYQEQCGTLDPNGYLIPSRVPNGWGTHVLNPEAKHPRPQDIVKRTLARYGWNETKMQGFHLLRASGARAWFDELDAQTVDGALKIVQAHLHHASVTMTEKYLGLTADRAKRDRLLRGETMFPSLGGDNLIDLSTRRETAT